MRVLAHVPVDHGSVGATSAAPCNTNPRTKEDPASGSGSCDHGSDPQPRKRRIGKRQTPENMPINNR